LVIVATSSRIVVMSSSRASRLVAMSREFRDGAGGVYRPELFAL
jgi:hypothetical protein